MKRILQGAQRIAGWSLRTAFVTIPFALIVLTAYSHAQTYTVVHAFTGGGDGQYPWTGLTMDRAGNLYGTTVSGGGGACTGDFGTGCGVVFKLSHTASGWVFAPLHVFTGSNDGQAPLSRLIFGPDGRLYGATANGGSGSCSTEWGSGCGIVFSLSPPQNACKSVLCPWTERIIYHFQGQFDGGVPIGDLAFDQAGNLYGTTIVRGANGAGVVYKLSPSNGEWTQTIVWAFTDYGDGGHPWGGVVFDSTGNLYGTTAAGGYFDQGECYEGCGTVFQLTPSDSSWTENTLHTFNGSDGGFSAADLIFDGAGNLYGNTTSGGSNNGGTVFELTPSGGMWTFSSLLTDLSNGIQGGPWATMTIDKSGNLLGTRKSGGLYGAGTVFTMTQTGGMWMLTDLHAFSGGTDGGNPSGSVTLDAGGNVYGTALLDGLYGKGVIFQITP